MTGPEFRIELLRQYITARAVAPWIVKRIDEVEIRQALHNLGGMAGVWRVDVFGAFT